MEIEVWKQVKGYENLYEVSNFGNVKSLAKTVIGGYNNGKAWYSNKKERILKPSFNLGKYKFVVLYNGKRNHENKSIHQLVAQAFIPNPENKKTVNHKNGIRDDNNLNNLEWNTYSENHYHAYKVLKRQCSNFGKRNGEMHNSKKVIQYTKNGDMVKVWDSMAEAARFGFRQGDISACCNKKYNHKTHKGFIWTFF